MVVYKAEFPNGKVYIGKSKRFKDRVISHKYSPKYFLTKMSNAIKKYGFECIT
jgi:predicted GIY-YIG superfamily endonuclease